MSKENDDTCPKCGSSVCSHIWELDTPRCEPITTDVFAEIWLPRLREDNDEGFENENVF